MKPTVFISHSAKDSEVAPVDPTDAAAVERRRRLLYTRTVRTAVVNALQQLEDDAGDQRLDVWLDNDILAGGDDWPARIHRALGECDGAVILLDPVSAASDWVHHEASILVWRQSLASKVRVVPVYCGEVAPDLVRTGAWGPIDIDRLHHVSLPGDPMTPESAAELAELVAERFATLQREDADTPTGQWIADVGALLEEVRRPALLDAAKHFGMTMGEWDALPDPHVTLAHHLLHCRLADAYDALLRLLQGLGREDGRRLIGLVAPIWVSAAAAHHLHRAVDGDGARLVLINLEHQESAEEYLDRAWCPRFDRSRFVRLPHVTGEHPEEVVEDMRRGLMAELGYVEGDQYVDAYIEDSRPLVIAGPNAADADVVRDMLSLHEAIRLVVLPGHDCRRARAALPHATMIEPPVTADQERDARVKLTRLNRNLPH